MQNSAKLKHLLTKWARLWGVPSLAQVEVASNIRLRSCLGRCFPKLHRIELNTSLFRKDRQHLNQVLCHEAAHIAAYALSQEESRPHGPRWILLMKKAGFKPETTISLNRCVPYEHRSKVSDKIFEHYCSVCRFVRFARKPIPRWKCRTCVSAGLSGDLKIAPRLVRRSDEP